MSMSFFSGLTWPIISLCLGRWQRLYCHRRQILNPRRCAVPAMFSFQDHTSSLQRNHPRGGMVCLWTTLPFRRCPSVAKSISTCRIVRRTVHFFDGERFVLLPDLFPNRGIMLPLAALRRQNRRLALHADHIARAQFIGLYRIQCENQIKRRDFGHHRSLRANEPDFDRHQSSIRSPLPWKRIEQFVRCRKIQFVGRLQPRRRL